MANDVEVTLTGSSAEAQQAWLELIGLVRQMKQETARVAKQLREAGQVGSKEFAKTRQAAESTMKTLQRFAQSAVVMQMVSRSVSMIRKELEAVKEIQDRIAGGKIEFAKVMRDFAHQMPQDSDITLGQAQARIEAASGLTPADQIARIAIGAMSAGQNIPVSERLDAAIAIANRFPGISQEDAGPVAAAIVNMKRAFGGTDEQKAASLFSAMSESRVEEKGEFALNVVGAAIKARSFGISEKEALSTISAITTASNDETGEVSATNFIKLLRQLQEEFTTAGVRFEGENPGDQMLRRIQDPNDPISRQIRMRLLGASNPAIDEAEAARAQGIARGQLRTREKTFVALQQLVTRRGVFPVGAGEENTQAFVESGRRNILVGDEATARIREIDRALGQNTTQNVLELKRATEEFKVNTTGALGSDRKAIVSIVSDLRQAIADANSSTGMITFNRSLESAISMATRGESSETILSFLRSKLENEVFVARLRAEGRQNEPADVREEAERTASALEILLSRIEAILESVEQNTRNPRVTLEEQEAPARPGGQ